MNRGYHILLFALCFCLFKSELKAQGTISYSEPAGLDRLVEKYKKDNFSSPGIEGYRVQIFSDAGNHARERATAALAEFQESFPETKGYLTYQQPNFKVRVGDFRYKSEARKMQKSLQIRFPSSFIVKDFIQTP